MTLILLLLLSVLFTRVLEWLKMVILSFFYFFFFLTVGVGTYDDARVNLVSVQRLLQRAMKTSKHQRDYLSYIVQAEVRDYWLLML